MICWIKLIRTSECTQWIFFNTVKPSSFYRGGNWTLSKLMLQGHTANEGQCSFKSRSVSCQRLSSSILCINSFWLSIEVIWWTLRLQQEAIGVGKFTLENSLWKSSPCTTMKCTFVFVLELDYSQLSKCSVQVFHSARGDAEKYFNRFYYTDCELGRSMKLAIKLSFGHRMKTDAGEWVILWLVAVSLLKYIF